MKKQTKKIIKKAMTIEDLATTVGGLATKVGGLVGTIEDLALITQRGFEGLEQRMREEFKQELKETEKRLTEKLDDRCDRIEFILLRDQSNRLERLEDKMRRVETALEIEA